MMNPLAAYRETRIKTAGPGQIIVMLYAEAVKQLDIALDLFDKDIKRRPDLIEPFNKAIVKTQDIITELTASLDFEAGGEIAKNLYSLYTFFNRSLMEGNFNKDSRPIKSVRDMMADLHGAWAEIVPKTATVETGERAGVNIAG